jgi:hypothetical protein
MACCLVLLISNFIHVSSDIERHQIQVLGKGGQIHASDDQIPELKYMRAVVKAREIASSSGVDFGSAGEVVRITTGASFQTVVWKFSFDNISVIAKGTAWESRVSSWLAAKSFSNSKLGPRLFWPLVNPRSLVNPANDTGSSATQFITAEEFIHGTPLNQIADSSNFIADVDAMTQLGGMVAKLHALPLERAAAGPQTGPLTCTDFGVCLNEGISRWHPELRERADKCLEANGASIGSIAKLHLELPALIQRLIEHSDSRSLLEPIFAHNDLNGGNIIKVRHPRGGLPYRFIDSVTAAESRVPWSDFSLLTINVQITDPISKGRKPMDYEPQGPLAFARSYLQTRGLHGDDESSENFVFIAQAFGLWHLIRKGIKQGLHAALRNENGAKHSSPGLTCAALGRLLSPESLHIAASILERAAIDPHGRGRLLKQGMWGAWQTALQQRLQRP